MGAWTKQPGDVSLYALIRRDQITAQRLDALATFASNRLGRAITRQRVIRWLRKYAAFTGEHNGAEYVSFEMPETMVANLPPLFADQFGTREELPAIVADKLDNLNALLGTEEADL